jgi:predicted DsbA family dithiol-disulfide isomerase
MDVSPGTIVVFADVGCPFAHIGLHRLLDTRARLDLDDAVALDIRAFPLELFNDRPTPKHSLDLEIAALSQAVPEAGWQAWSDRDYRFPVTMLPPMEAVQAAKLQSFRAAEQLDHRLRTAFFAESRCISMRHEILACAAECAAVDVAALTEALDDGRARRTVIDQWEQSQGEDILGSPHLFLPDGSEHHNPGMEHHWEGPQGGKTMIVDRNDATVYEQIVRAAAGVRA